MLLVIRAGFKMEGGDGAACCTKHFFPGAESQRLFDVEIGQFESIAFNFSQVTGTPLV